MPSNAPLGLIMDGTRCQPQENACWGLQAGYGRYDDSSELLMLLCDMFPTFGTPRFLTAGVDEGLVDLLLILPGLRASRWHLFYPSYPFHASMLQRAGIRVLEHCGLTSQEDVSLLLAGLRPRDGDVILIANPTNPTGQLVPPEEVLGFAERFPKCIVVVDEAFIAFREDAGLAPFLNMTPNLCVLRSLSKGFGLPAARLGWVATSNPAICDAWRVWRPAPVVSIGQLEVVRDLHANFDEARARLSCRRLAAIRLIEQLRALGYPIAAGVTNQVAVVGDCAVVDAVVRRLRLRGIHPTWSRDSPWARRYHLRLTRMRQAFVRFYVTDSYDVDCVVSALREGAVTLT